MQVLMVSLLVIVIKAIVFYEPDNFQTNCVCLTMHLFGLATECLLGDVKSIIFGLTNAKKQIPLYVLKVVHVVALLKFFQINSFAKGTTDLHVCTAILSQNMAYLIAWVQVAYVALFIVIMISQFAISMFSDIARLDRVLSRAANIIFYRVYCQRLCNVEHDIDVYVGITALYIPVLRLINYTHLVEANYAFTAVYLLVLAERVVHDYRSIDHIKSKQHIDLNESSEEFIVIEMPNDVCSICINDICIGNTARNLKCDHVYHRDCIDLWVAFGGRFCPTCKNYL